MGYEPGLGVYNEPPRYSKTCECGITITGISEKGLSSLVKRHIESGVIHLEWKDK